MNLPAFGNRQLGIALGVALALGGLIWLLSYSTGDTKAEDRLEWLTRLELPLVVSPTASGAQADDNPDSPVAAGMPVAAATEQRLLLYLDTSRPLGGYLPVAGSETAVDSPFRALSQVLVDNLVQTYGGSGDIVTWMSISSGLEAWPQHLAGLRLPARSEPRFLRQEFTGNETCLDLAVSDAIGHLEAGRAGAAALVTDMVATCGVTGALGVSKALVDWMSSPAVRRGDFEVALFGTRIPYSGVHSELCEAAPGELGCWFSERAHGYRRLSGVVARPLYVLVLARGEPRAPGDLRRPTPLARLAAELANDVDEELEPRWEVLTASVGGLPGTLRCDAPAGQRTLLRAPSGLFRCQLAKPLALDCGIAVEANKPAGDGAPRWGPAKVHVSWPTDLAQAAVAGDRITLAIDCERVQAVRPAAPLRIDELALAPPDLALLWRDWSAVSDEQEEDLTGTLQLARFVESLKPRHYNATLSAPLLGRP